MGSANDPLTMGLSNPPHRFYEREYPRKSGTRFAHKIE